MHLLLQDQLAIKVSDISLLCQLISTFILDNLAGPSVTDTIQIIDKCPPTISIEGLQRDSAEIEIKFAKLVASLFQSLTSRSISKDKLVSCLMGLNCLTKVYNGENQTMFRKQRRKFDDPSATIGTVWNVIGDYFSFFDYDILELIADTLGDDSDRQNFAKYKEDFQAYGRRRLIIDKTSLHNDCESNGENTKKLAVLDPSYDDCEIGQLKRLQIKLSQVLNIGILQLCRIKEESVQLVSQSSNFISPIRDFKISSNLPPPLAKTASSKLHSAVFNGELTKVRLLVEVFHCSPLAVNREGHTALHTAGAIGELTILKYFIEDRLVNAATESVGEETPLHCAAENGHVSTVMYLVGVQLVDPQILNGQHMSPLHSACLSGDLSTVQYLMFKSQQQPCNLNERTLTGHTLIDYAVKSGSSEVIKFIQYTDKPVVKKESVNYEEKVRFTCCVHEALPHMASLLIL